MIFVKSVILGFINQIKLFIFFLTREFPEKFLLLRGEHKIPWYLLYNKTMEYKYVVTGPSRGAGGQYEFLYKKASGQAIINRELSIPNEKCRVDGTFLCFMKNFFFSEGYIVIASI